MLLTQRHRMGKGRGGRPRKDEGDGTTRQIRVFTDLADMIGDIVDLQDVSVANLVDEWLRPHVTARHAALKSLIDQMKKTRTAAQKKEKKD